MDGVLDHFQPVGDDALSVVLHQILATLPSLQLNTKYIKTPQLHTAEATVDNTKQQQQQHGNAQLQTTTWQCTTAKNNDRRDKTLISIQSEGGDFNKEHPTTATLKHMVTMVTERWSFHSQL